jgi:alginate O-acetyltransferase complex protein AlgI
MTFNSFTFAIFLPIVYVLYWALQGRALRWQNLVLLTAAYVFYGWWDYRFLILLFLNCIVDWATGLWLAAEQRPGRRKLVLAISLAANLGVLGFFKYFGFFADSVARLLTLIGWKVHPATLGVVLPVGISFYTFQSLSYTIDIYRRRLEPTRDLLGFLTFHSFFPQLVAGPIERASELLPQCLQPRRWSQSDAADGCRQMLWGLFKKVAIADRLAPLVDEIFAQYQTAPAPVLFVGTFFFALQIYCDFSGYSDIALGTARLFGFRLMRNFAFPYFSRDIAEFWRRWHISLSTWFRDYLYIPLGGNRGGAAVAIRNILVTFVLSGLWHGANWTFLIWGLLNGLYYIPIFVARNQRRSTDTVAAGRLLPSVAEALRMGLTFLLVLVAWVFFRATSLEQAFVYLARMFGSGGELGTLSALRPYLTMLGWCAAFLAVEWLQRARQHALQVGELPVALRWPIYWSVATLIFLHGSTGDVPFIYFQF